MKIKPVGTVVGTFTSIDKDTDSTFTYTLNTSDVPFVIDGNKLKTNNVLDYNLASSYNITVIATDNTDLTYSKDFIIYINNINYSPTDILLSNANVDENRNIGYVVGTFTSIDKDTDSTFTYTLNTSDVPFEIDGDKLKTTRQIDYESDPTSYLINVTTTDNSGLTYSKDFTISINNINEPSTDLTLSLTNNTLDEDEEIGYVVGTFTTTDPDNNNTFTYTITDNSSVPFVIDGDKLTVSNGVDYESTPSYTFDVTSNDGSNNIVRTFTIYLNEVPEPPTDIFLSNTTVSEYAQIGTLVGIFSNNDSDVNATATYNLNTPGVPFRIIQNYLYTNGVLNYETQSSYVINVTTTDNTGFTFSKDITINVGDENEAPTILYLTSSNVDEDVPIGYEIGQFKTNDPDTNDNVTFTILQTDIPFEIDVSGNIGILKTTEKLDYEIKNSYTFYVQYNDGLNTIFNGFTITVHNKDDAPINITIDNANVSEDAVSGTLIGVFTTEDENGGDHTYSIIDNNDIPFYIVENTNELRTNGGLDRKTKSSYTFSVQTVDNTDLKAFQNYLLFM